MPRNVLPPCRERRRPPPFSMYPPDVSPHHGPHPGGTRRPYPSPNRRNIPYSPCTPPNLAFTPHFMFRPSDQVYDQESPDSLGDDDEQERRRSPSFRRTPGASRPRTTGPGGGGPRSPAPGYYLTWDNSPKTPFHQSPSGHSQRMLHASDLCGGTGDARGGATGGGDVTFRDDDGEPRLLSGGAVELRINNLDYNISAREWKKILVAEFVQHVKVLDAYIQTQADNTNVGYVRLGSIDEARFAISKLHRKKVGYKRIHVSLVDESNSSSPNTKSEVVGLLKEVSDNSLPLFKFIDMFEKRFHRGISVSELYRMRSCIQIEDKEGSGRTVSLPPPPASVSDETNEENEEEGMLEPPVCKAHCIEGSPAYVTAMDADCLPNVIIQLKTFAAQVHTLLQSHDGNMALMSFQCCYEAELKELKVTQDGGVPVEHLISCVPGVKVAITKTGIKKIQWAENKPTGAMMKNNPMTTESLAQFGREVVDLLKHSTQCRLSFVRFIPAYHRFLGRQCRVADYGYTKLMELLEAIPNVVQVIGSGNRRVVMLSHRSQVKRFTTDILRVLKSQICKQISVTDLPVIYNVVIGRPFSITDYGVCFIEDMLCEIPESTIQVQGAGLEMVILITRREQTLAEMELTQQFAVEVIDLLSHSPHCRMSFNKFIPAYHHHFGKQCRVADYGFVKLLDLFEAIPNVVQIEEEEEDKVLCLVDDELFKVLEEQIAALLKSKPNIELPVPEFLNAFRRRYGHSLRLQDFGVSSVSALIKHIPQTATIEQVNGHSVIHLVDHEEEHQLARRAMLLLMEECTAVLTLEDMCARHSMKYNKDLTQDELSSLHQYVQLYEDGSGKGTKVKLTALYMFARDIRTLLLINKCRLSLQHIEPVFAHYYGVALVPQSYGYPSLYSLIQSIPLVVILKGKGYRRMALLTPEFQESDIRDAAEWQTLTHHTPITSPSGDSGITDCTDLSPTHERIMMVDAMASPILEGKPEMMHSRRYYDSINESIPEMLPTYNDEMGDYGNGATGEDLTLSPQSYNQPQYSLRPDYQSYSHDSSYLQPPPYMPGGGGGQEAFYPQYPTYDYMQGAQYMPYEPTMQFYNQHNSSPPIEYTGECDPGVVYMVAAQNKVTTPDATLPPYPPIPYSPLSQKPEPCAMLKKGDALGGAHPNSEMSNSEMPISLEAASAKLKNLIISAPPPQLITKAEPWVDETDQGDTEPDVNEEPDEEAPPARESWVSDNKIKVDGEMDVDPNNNTLMMPDLNLVPDGSQTVTVVDLEEAMFSPSSVKSEGRNDSGCQEDEEVEIVEREKNDVIKHPPSPRKTRLAARFKGTTDDKVELLATARTEAKACK